MAVDPQGNGGAGSLYMGGFSGAQTGTGLIAEITIPTPVIATNSTLLPRAVTIQPMGDVAPGLHPETLTSNSMGNVLVDLAPNTLEWVLVNYYLPATTATSFGCSTKILSAPNAQGPVHIGPLTNDYATAATSRYLFKLPAAWSVEHTAGLRIGAGRERIVNWGSWGPGVYAVDSLCPPLSPAPAQRIMWYPGENEVDCGSGACHPVNNFSNADDYNGAAWVTVGNKQALVFAVNKAERTYVGRGNIACPGTTTDPADTFCGGLIYGDPQPHSTSTDKGFHGDPKSVELQFFDVNDVTQAADGLSATYAPQPYARFNFENHRFNQIIQNYISQISGPMAYDDVHQRLYVSETRADGPIVKRPIVHVWAVGDAGLAPDTTPPSVPADLTITSASTSGVSITWTPSTDEHEIFYVVRRNPVDEVPDPTWPCNCAPYGNREPAQAWPIALIIKNTYTDTKELVSGKTYTYSVKARDSAGNDSDWSPEVSVTVP